MRGLSFLSCLGLVVLCPVCSACSTSAPPDSEANTDAGTAGGSAVASCSSNEDCDDGKPCNGQEQCAPDEEAADEDGCVAGRPVDCRAPGCSSECDETTGACIANDVDGDGHDDHRCGGTDCDDDDFYRHPGNPEVCDLEGHDEDCDPLTFGLTDNDGDLAYDARCCNTDAEGNEICGNDCNDGVANSHPRAPEVCDGIDNDCDGEIDEGLRVSGFADRDRDDRGDPDSPMMGCPGTFGFVGNAGDCDDDNAQISDKTPETCDGIDNDCDGEIDENPRPVPWYVNVDADSHGLLNTDPPILCGPPEDGRTWTFIPGDCDDDNELVGPAAAELCDGIDNDCNNLADYAVTFGDYEDDDGDGYADAACGGDDCDDRDVTTHPGAKERKDGRDNDCDGKIDETDNKDGGSGALRVTFYKDEDGDGRGNPKATISATVAPVGFVAIGDDCDDDRADVSPVASEVCDGRDNDCDGKTDEQLLVLYCSDADGDGVGAAGGICELHCPGSVVAGMGIGLDDCAPLDDEVHPGAPERCDEVDQDCDGIADCPSCGNGTCDESLGETSESCTADCPKELCNGIDDDADGTIDEACPSGFVHGGSSTVLPSDGEAKGEAFSQDCDAMKVLTGLRLWSDGVYVTGLGLDCSTPTWNTSSNPYEYAVSFTSKVSQSTMGSENTGPLAVTCGPGEAATGYQLNLSQGDADTPKELRGIRLFCAGLSGSQASTTIVAGSWSIAERTFSSEVWAPYRTCPADSFIVGAVGSHESASPTHVGEFAMTCRALNATLIPE